MDFYDGTKLLSLTDINRKKPEIYLATSNRSAGKTTYFTRLLINAFKKRQEKFAVLYRFNYELDDCAENIFKDLKYLFFPNDVMTSKRKSNGIYHELFLNDVSCGYAISINSADQLKKRGHYFSDVTRMFMDEFQSENNHYCPDEVKKLQSIHTTIARGQGKNIRYVPLYMVSNPVTLINPYYVALGISNRLSSKIKFLKGDGFVLEQGYIESIAQSQKESAFNRAFANEAYTAYAAQGIYLNDNNAFVEKPIGKSIYLATIRYKGADYGLRQYTDLGIIYCDNKPDKTYKYKLAVTTDDHNINYVMLRTHRMFVENMRYFFDNGCFRFKNLQCKNVILNTLSY